LISMEFEDIIKARRSVRKYQDKPVEEEKIVKCLEASRLAPSWKNGQCWRFVVVKDKGIIDKLATGINTWAKAAPVMIVACGDPRLSGDSNGQLYYLVDVAIAMEHLVLEATNLGLGTCWLGIFDEAEVKGLLKIPEEIRVVALTPLGYPLISESLVGDTKPVVRVKKRKNLEEIAFEGEWGKPLDKQSMN